MISGISEQGVFLPSINEIDDYYLLRDINPNRNLYPRIDEVSWSTYQYDCGFLSNQDPLLNICCFDYCNKTWQDVEKTVSINFDSNWKKIIDNSIYITFQNPDFSINDGKTHLDSVAEAVFNAVLGALESFVKAVKELASKVFNWIWNVIKTLMNKIMKPIWDGLVFYVQKIYDVIENFFSNNIQNGVAFSASLFGASPSLFDAFNLLGIILQVVIGIVFVFSTVMSGGTFAGLGIFIKECINSAIKNAQESIFKIAGGFIIGEIFGLLVAQFIPSNAKNTQITGIISLIIPFVVFTLQIVFSKKKNISIKGMKGDITGLAVATIGFVIMLIVVAKAQWNDLINIALAILGLLLSGLGLFIGLASTSVLDSTPLGMLDEIVSGAMFGYAVVSLIASLANALNE